MKIEEALEESKKVISPKRYAHVERVTEMALQLTDRFGGNRTIVGLAAGLHDYAKEFDPDELKQVIQTSDDLPDDLLQYNEELLHGPAGSKIIKERFGIDDPLILGAIRYHTTGKPAMPKEEKIVFLADYIEPGRDFPAAEEARKLAQENLEEACRFALRETIQFLLSRDQLIYPDTFIAYNDLTMK